MKSSYRFYRGCYHIARVLFKTFFFYSVRGRENVPSGSAMVCANHSSLLDPIIISLALGIDHFVHYIAKIELFRVPVVATVITKLGAISVDRDKSDVTTVKATLGYLKNDEKVAIFPEGRRVLTDEAALAKNGAVKIAERTGVPVVPVFVPRRKPVFRKLKVVIGVPYYIEKQDDKRTADDYTLLAETLMGKIEALNPESGD